MVNTLRLGSGGPPSLPRSHSKPYSEGDLYGRNSLPLTDARSGKYRETPWTTTASTRDFGNTTASTAPREATESSKAAEENTAPCRYPVSYILGRLSSHVGLRSSSTPAALAVASSMPPMAMAAAPGAEVDGQRRPTAAMVPLKPIEDGVRGLLDASQTRPSTALGTMRSSVFDAATSSQSLMESIKSRRRSGSLLLGPRATSASGALRRGGGASGSYGCVYAGLARGGTEVVPGGGVQSPVTKTASSLSLSHPSRSGFGGLGAASPPSTPPPGQSDAGAGGLTALGAGWMAGCGTAPHMDPTSLDGSVAMLRSVQQVGAEEGILPPYRGGARTLAVSGEDAGSTTIALPTASLSPTAPHSRGGGVDAMPLAGAEAQADTCEASPAVQYAADAIGLTPVLASAMPQGRCLILNFLASWGDVHEIGLCAIELFDHEGHRILPRPCAVSSSATAVEGSSLGGGVAERPAMQQLSIQHGVVTLSATSPDGTIRVLAEYTATAEELQIAGDAEAMAALRADPRRQLLTLIQPHNVNTHDEADMFVFPYSPGQHHLLCIFFKHPVTLSTMRIHNYCGRGRVHTSKGVRVMEATMDDAVIFRGEIRAHSGELIRQSGEGWALSPSPENAYGIANCENIIWASREDVLRRVMTHGPPHYPVKDAEEVSTRGQGASSPPSPEENRLVRAKSHQSIGTRFTFRSDRLGAGDYSDGGGSGGGRSSVSSRREHTASASRGRGTTGGPHGGEPVSAKGQGQLSEHGGEAAAVRRYAVQYPDCCPTQITSLCILVLTTWGDAEHMGLSGLRLRDIAGDVIPVPLRGTVVHYPDGAWSRWDRDSGSSSNDGTSNDADAEANMPACLVRGLCGTPSTTACALTFQSTMQIVLVFDGPIETIGFLDVANYSVGDATFCGVKEARVFFSEGPGPISSSAVATVADIYQCLWTAADSPSSQMTLRGASVYEVTPPEGVTLRKAPALVDGVRFQSYDVSLLGTPDSHSSDLEWGGIEATAEESLSSQAMRYTIAIGPGTGGAVLSNGGGMLMDHGFTSTAASRSLASSLSASINIRATMAMKRARMLLRDRPDWLLDYQPYLTPLLPVGYVCKVRLFVCARDIATEAKGDHRAGHTAEMTVISAATTLKAYLKEWVVKPLRACSFVNENGDVIKAMRPDKYRTMTRAAQNPSSSANAVSEEELARRIPMVAETVVSTRPDSASGAHATPASGTTLQVTVDLLYVSDMPFCISVLAIHGPLVVGGSAAWVRQMQVSMDDAVIFSSGDAAVRLATEGSSPAPSAGATRRNRPGELTGPDSSTLWRALPRCSTSLRRYVVFTLDETILSDIRGEVDGAA